MKCASSAEADVSDQAVALCIAVTPQTARRCDLLVWLLLRTAATAFATMPLDAINKKEWGLLLRLTTVTLLFKLQIFFKRFVCFNKYLYLCSRK